jgi:uroporphyrinogen-III synthase
MTQNPLSLMRLASLDARSSLAGKRILITRPRAQAADLSQRLAALGAIPILFPTIEIEPLADTTVLEDAIRNLATYDWLVFTSVNGVNVFSDLTGLPDLAGLSNRIAVIGPATAQAVEQRGGIVALIPAQYVAESLIESLGEVRGQRILIPRAQQARAVLSIELQRRGAIVDEIAVYRAKPSQPDPAALIELKRGVNAITFTSASTVRNFISSIERWPNEPAIICIGPITAQTARASGLTVSAIAAEYTTAGLVAALVQYFTQTEQAHVH